MNLADKLRDIEPNICTSQWSGYEHYKGYGVMALPFSSGHLLGLRVFPENDFAPYISVWHRTPEGAWSIYNDGHSLETTCPRWWGPALKHAELTSIKLTWRGPNQLHVDMENPKLSWSMSITAPLPMRLVNAINAAQPLWTWKPSPLLRMREWAAKWFFGMGNLRFSFVTPSGFDAIIMPQKSFFISSSDAILEGSDLGTPVKLPGNPTIGSVPLPTRPVFITGQAHAKYKDPEEYLRLRKQLART